MFGSWDTLNVVLPKVMENLDQVRKILGEVVVCQRIFLEELQQLALDGIVACPRFPEGLCLSNEKVENVTNEILLPAREDCLPIPWCFALSVKNTGS